MFSNVYCSPLDYFFGQRFCWVFIDLGKTIHDATFWTGVYSATDRPTDPTDSNLGIQNGKYGQLSFFSEPRVNNYASLRNMMTHPPIFFYRIS